MTLGNFTASSGFFQRQQVFSVAIALWLAVIASSLYWNWRQIEKSVLELAATEAQASINKDLVYRRWAAMHGGVYAPPTGKTPPSPYLAHLPYRDVTTTTGKNLTLINPAYMTRQAHELGQGQYGAQGHITSLNPLRPENSADAWEAEALQSFESGAKEVRAIANMDGRLFMRVMRPLITEAGCLKCHAGQGYQEGDIRGGLSVSVPFAPYKDIALTQQKQLAFWHVLFGVLGGLALWVWRLGQIQFENSLREKEKKYRIVADNTYDWEFWLSPERQPLYISPSCQRITGYSTEEFFRKPSLFTDIVHPDDRAMFDNHVCREQQQNAGEIMFRIRHQDGGQRWIGHVCQPLFDAQNLFLGTRSTNRDITELKRNELWLRTRSNLREHAMRYELGEFLTKALDEAENLTASTISFFLFLDADQRAPNLQAWSTNTLRHVGTAAGKGAHQSVEQGGVWTDCLHERRAVIHNDYEGLAHRRGFPDGHPRIARELVAPIMRNQQIVAIIGVGNKTAVYDEKDVSILTDFSNTVWDIVLQKQTEEEKAKIENQLRQVQKMEAIGTLAGGIAHDFNNILSAVMGYTEMAHDETPAQSPVRDYLHEVLKAGDRAKGLVQQILAFSRHAEQEYRPLHLHLIIKEAVKLLRATIPATIAMKQNINPDCGPVLADPTQAHQIIMNLCTNAYHAMRETGGILGVSLAPVEIGPDDPKVNGFVLSPGPYVELTVSDTGCGMDKKTIERMFDPYFTTKGKGEGTGLGLAVVHGIVKSFGGYVSVDSEPGKGSTFRIYLPQVAGRAAAEAPVAPLPCLRGTERILFVDDEETIISVAEAMLSGLGYQVTALPSALEALKTFQHKAGDFDLVITDMTMPHMTGVALTRRLRTIRPDIPVILCTGFSELVNEEKSRSFGIDEYLSKPLLKKDLSAAIRRVLDKKMV
ncbi:MAG: DUF3365 domain-containing protein [Deltaproteobacteria bacterium]|nr:DUF3365 domain-containing protein [Deltaproteobacteria bacterium]